MKTYTGHDIATITFEFHGETRTVDLAEEALLDFDDLPGELEQADAKRAYWGSVLAKLRRKAKISDIEVKRAENNVKYTEHLKKMECLEGAEKKPSDKVMESEAKSSVEYQEAQNSVYAAQEMSAQNWELVDAVEELVKTLRSEKGRTDAIHFFLGREGLRRDRTVEGGKEGYKKHKKKKQQQQEEEE